ncbi:MAG TPA: 16S rRNA (cytosine(1402)-N(4))-methyltransferase RsmH [Candidatus Paceibacterota bacterium]
MRTRRLKSSSGPVPSTAFAEASANRRGHRTVLLHEAIEQLAIKSDDIVVDATLGAAGHAVAIATKLGNKGKFIGIDADKNAIERAEKALEHFHTLEIHLIQENFRNLQNILHKLGISNISKALFDLGWSGYQLEEGRGFSFLKDEPLLMTYADNTGSDELTAKTIVNEWSEESLADIIYGWGEERYSRRIARKIVERRAAKPFETSKELAELIKEAVPSKYRYGRLHPATRTFQALRIAVNDELGALKAGLNAAWTHLVPGGRIAVLSFHSIEDREVKHAFADWEKAGAGKRINRSPIIPSAEEIAENPRSRSAKLRVIEKSAV